jgi:hypothetical protein
MSKQKVVKYTLEEFQRRYQKLTNFVRCECEFAAPCVGGVPADEDGIRAFIKHVMRIDKPDEIEAMLRRIKSEEIGEKRVDQAEDELEEKLTYGVNVIRRTKHGPWIGNWMIQANLKCAVSRLGHFVHVKGLKGGMAECGHAIPYGQSKKDEDNRHIYLYNGDKEVETYWDQCRGVVNTPKGKQSIVRDQECAKPGTKFAYEFRFVGQKKFDLEAMLDSLAMAMIIGIGSSKSLGNGNYKIVNFESNLK